MRALATTLVLCVLFGCGGGFATNGEELAYLSSLSNPTPEQWKRKNELGQKAAIELEKYAAEIALKRETERQAFVKQEAEREKVEAESKVQELMSRAKEYEAKGEPGVASRVYKDVIEKHPNSFVVPEAVKRRADCEIKAYGKTEATP